MDEPADSAPKETGVEVKEDEGEVATEKKSTEETNKDPEKEAETKETEDATPVVETAEAPKEPTKPEESTETIVETTGEEKNNAEKDESAAASTEAVTETKPAVAGEDGMKVEIKADDTAAKPEVEVPPKEPTSEASPVKKEDPGLTAHADDSMAVEPKSELVAAAEEDAKNNKDQPAPCESAVRPNNRDVLFGRGKPFQNHPGNRKMLQYIDQYKRQYNESPRDQKRPIVEEIIGILTAAGGRFLRRYNEDVNSTWWTEVPKQVAFDKVSHAFRSRGRPKASDSAQAKASLAQARAAAAAVAHTGHPHQGHPHHPQHPATYAAHHQGQYGGVPPPGAQFGGQFGQYGMPPGQFNPMIAAMQQHHHHNPMMGYHPMPSGITAQQQAMMQAGMMVAMQQQQQGGPPGAPQPPYYQQPPAHNPYYAQQPQHHQQPPPPQPHPQEGPPAPPPGQAPAPGFAAFPGMPALPPGPPGGYVAPGVAPPQAAVTGAPPPPPAAGGAESKLAQ